MNRRLILLLLAALALAVPLSLLAGRVWISPFGGHGTADTVIVLQLRLPRALLALVLGAGLGCAGAAMQGYLRNPLADPGLFGIAPGAALGAVLSFWTGYAASAWLLPVFALIGAGGAMALLALIAGRNGGLALFTLAGLMISSLAGALTSLAISLSPTPFAMSEIVTWLMGALADRSWHEVGIATPPTVIGIAVLLKAGRSLDALTLGEAAARSLGVDPRRLQVLMIAGIGLTVGAGVAVAGIIGFVGLIVPHLVRPLTDRRPSSLLLPSALAGALLLLVADCLCRVLPLSGAELRLGIALSLLGAPVLPGAAAADAAGAGMMLAACDLHLPGRLDGVSMALREGEVTAICGPNGAGKSSLLSCLAGLERPVSGQVLLAGESLALLGGARRAQRIGYLPQAPEVAWNVSVEVLVSLGRLPWPDVPAGAARAAVDAALAAMDLMAFRHRPVSQLSGGERARALMARVLATGPDWLLADEPLASLDLAHAAGLVSSLRREAQAGRGVVLVLHDLATAMNHADRVIVLDRGKVAADGSPGAALQEDVIATVWGVRGRWLGEPGARALSLG